MTDRLALNLNNVSCDWTTHDADRTTIDEETENRKTEENSIVDPYVFMLKDISFYLEKVSEYNLF